MWEQKIPSAVRNDPGSPWTDDRWTGLFGENVFVQGEIEMLHNGIPDLAHASTDGWIVVSEMTLLGLGIFRTGSGVGGSC